MQRPARDSVTSGYRVDHFPRDLHVLEARQVPGNRSVEIELPLLYQHHRSDTGDGLGHRCDPENRIRAHCDCFIAILETYCLQVRELAIPGDRHNRARQITSLDMGLIPGRYPRESRRREA